MIDSRQRLKNGNHQHLINLCQHHSFIYKSLCVSYSINNSYFCGRALTMVSTNDYCNYDFPPTLKYHILDGNAPRQFYYFWSIGTICLIATAVFIIPSIITIYNEAKTIRESMDTALLPFSYQICVIILAFPLIGVFFNALVLFAPVTESIFVFMLNIYNALTLYVFARLLVMYLGSYQSAIKIWRDPSTKPTKYYASKPCCCLKPCIKERKMTKHDFRNIYYLIQQYIFIGPFIIFLSLFFKTAINVYYQDLTGQIVGTVQICSSLGCLYGSQCLLNASRQLLKEYEISGKFKMVQFGIMTLTVPSALLSLIGVNTKINDVYNQEVMDQAWSGIISIILYTILSYFYKRYFNVQTARNAMRNAKTQSHTASLKSNTQIIDLVHENNNHYNNDNDYTKLDDNIQQNEIMEQTDKITQQNHNQNETNLDLIVNENTKIIADNTDTYTAL